MKKILLLCFGILALNIYSQSYTMGTDEWQPFRIDVDGKLYGIDIDLLDIIENKIELELNVSRKPWVRCLEDMKTGNVDLMLGLAYNDERAQYIKYLDTPYYSVTPVFFTKGKDIEINSYEDLKNYRIGYVKGSSYFPKFDNDEELNKIPVAHETQLIEMLFRGSIDIIIGTDIQIKYELKEKGLSKTVIEVKYKPDYKIDLYIGISRKSDFIEYKDILEEIISSLIKTKEIDDLILSYTN